MVLPLNPKHDKYHKIQRNNTMKIDKFTIGRFGLTNTDGTIRYFIDGEEVQFAELEYGSPEKITLEVLKEKYDHESRDNELKWES
jgi:hypothetical protein